MARTYEQIVEEAAAWLAPVSEAEPAGVSAKFDASYEALRAEIMKLDSPRGELVLWPSVVNTGAEILRSRSKDLLIAGHLGVALYHEQGFGGLATGTALITEVIDRYWDKLFPPLARIRARVGALEWFVEKAGLILGTLKTPEEKHREGLLELKTAVERFRAVVADKFGDNSPALSPFHDAIEKLIVCLPKPKAPPPAPPPPAPVAASASTEAAVAEVASEPASTSAGAPASITVPDVAAAPSASNREEVVKFLQASSKAFLDTASALRQVNPAAALAYRLLRSGMWLGVLDLPPVAANGRTMIPALPKDLRAKLDKFIETRNWMALLTEAEGALTRNRLSLDLLRYSAQAMAALGGGYEEARRVCLSELRSFLERMPGLPKLPTADGTPLADEPTRAWLEEEVLAAPGGGKSASRAGAAVLDEQVLAEVQKQLSAGKTAEALQAMERHVAAAVGGRARAQLRVLQADMCRKAGATKIAAALYEALDEELSAAGLVSWEPELQVRVLCGRLSCLRAVKKPTDKPDDEHELYKRLAKLDPAVALEVG